MSFYLDFTQSVHGGIPGKGVFNPPYAMVGVAPSISRPASHKLEPFGSKTFQVLQKVKPSLQDSDLYMTNLLKVPHPYKKKVYVRDIRFWQDLLVEELALIQPERILAVGSEVAQVLCPGFTNLSEDHGAFFVNEKIEAYVIPTFHFSMIQTNPDYAKIVLRDLQRFFDVKPDVVPLPTLFTAVSDLPTLSGEVIIDIETTGLTLDCDITKIGLSWTNQDGHVEYWIIENPTQTDVHEFNEKLAAEADVVTGHNIAFDSYILAGKDFDPLNSNLANLRYRDTMLLAHNTGKYSSLRLKHLITMCTDQPGPHSHGSWSDGDGNNGYLVSDLMGTRALSQKYEKEENAYSARLMCDMSGIFGTLRARGVYINLKRLAEVAKPLEQQKQDLYRDLCEVADINWRSTAQVSQALLEAGVPLTEITKGGQVSVAEPILISLAEDYELVQSLLDFRSTDKLLSGFIEPYLANQNPYIYPSLLIHGTTTGRLSCKNPNLQQIPRVGPFKRIFQSRWHEVGGLYGLVDLSQAELRVAALLSGDKDFAKALQEEDAHRYIASMAFGKPIDEITSTERKASKAITFGLLYGGSIGGLAKRANLPPENVKMVLQEFFKVFPALNTWIESFRERSNYVNEVITPFGRHRDLTMVRHYESSNGVFRKSINTPVQSAASDIMLSIIRVTYRGLVKRGLKSRPLFAVHDSQLLEIYPGETEQVIECIQEAFASLMDTPLRQYSLAETLPFIGEVVLGKDWASCESTSEFYEPLGSYPVSSLG